MKQSEKNIINSYVARINCASIRPFNPPKSRAGKLFFFRHYQTDAPI